MAVFTPSGIDTGGVATALDPVEIDQSEFAWRANRRYRLAIVIDRSDPMTTRLRYNDRQLLVDCLLYQRRLGLRVRQRQQGAVMREPQRAA